ncbi:CBS domain-containing protein [Nitrospirales bacterium NOB]|nr:CBS domain-containing protein [Nitrospirales bacterium NOB]
MKTGRRWCDICGGNSMSDHRKQQGADIPPRTATPRRVAGLYLESTKEEELGLLPGEAKQVREAMSTRVTIASPGTSLKDAAGLMNKLDVPVLVVYDGARLSGMLTERDMGLSHRIREAPPETAIERCMRSPIPSCYQDDLLAEAIALMRASHLDWLPVQDRRHRLVGVLSIYAASP